MKRNYTTLEMEIIVFENEDIITDSDSSTDDENIEGGDED